MKITRIRTHLLQPGAYSFSGQAVGQRLVIVEVETSEPGLTGLGCATFTQRHRAVAAALEHHLGPFFIGKDPRNTEDLWQSAAANGYWRNGPVLNNALSGIDMALWDIKGKLAGLPCHQLWGGKSRPAAAVYTHCDGRDFHEVADAVRARLSEGFHYLRAQCGDYAGATPAEARRPRGAPPGAYYDDRAKLRTIPALFDHLRAEFGPEVEFLHDVHERLFPTDAIWLAKTLEPHRLFFLEDPLAPEDNEWFANLRAQTATPIAMGELFNHPREITPLVKDRLIDFVRVHVSQIGGITPALKLAHLCDAFGVRFAWHGPLDTSPVGMAACLHLDVALHNFGIQEWATRPEAEYEIFPGLPRVERGYVYPPEKPGLGIDFNPAAAAQWPCDDNNPEWTVARLPDGSFHRP
ncbi:MAG: starvation-sensing protein RspA [Puniceicoccaceae bacterium]|nr:MAG: starvation-sensing protein RspA [Puniceicoccaceae bacterium]